MCVCVCVCMCMYYVLCILYVCLLLSFLLFSSLSLWAMDLEHGVWSVHLKKSVSNSVCMWLFEMEIFFLDFVSVIYLFIFGSFVYIPFLFRNSNPNLSKKWMDVLKEIWGFSYIFSFLLEGQVSPVFSMYVWFFMQTFPLIFDGIDLSFSRGALMSLKEVFQSCTICIIQIL